jgi:putative endonuclease
MPYFVYLLRCSDNSLYCGYTSDIRNRVASHNSGSGSKYVRARRPAELVYFERLPGQRAAMRRELAIKRLPKRRKEALAASRGGP